MGGNTSGIKGPSDELWKGDIKNMFSSAKMTEPYDFKPVSVFPLKSDDSGVYAFITNDGCIKCISEVLPDVKLEARIPCSKVNYVSLMNQNTLVLSTPEAVYLAEYRFENIAITEVDIKNSLLTVTIDENHFVACTKENVMYSVKDKEKEYDSITFEERFEADYGTVLLCKPRILVLSSMHCTYYCLLSDSVKLLKSSDMKAVKKILNYENMILFIDNDSEFIFRTRINSSGMLDNCEPIKINDSPVGKKIIDFELLSNGCVVILHESSFTCIYHNSKPFTFNFPDYTVPTKLFRLDVSPFFVVYGGDGTLYFCKSPDFSKIDIDPDNVCVELPHLHMVGIRHICALQEASFITFDDNQIIIQWNNFPNWLNTPSFVNMFGEQRD